MASGDTLATLYPQDSQRRTTDGAVLGKSNDHVYVAYDDSTDQGRRWAVVIGNGYAGGGFTLRCLCAMDTATSGYLGLVVRFDRLASGGLMSSDTFDSDTAATVEVPSTAEERFWLTFNVAAADTDDLTAGDVALIEIERDTSVASDASGDGWLVAAELREA